METRHLDTAFTVAKYNERLSTRRDAEKEEVRQEQTGRSNNECIRGPGVATAFRPR